MPVAVWRLVLLCVFSGESTGDDVDQVAVIANLFEIIRLEADIILLLHINNQIYGVDAVQIVCFKQVRLVIENAHIAVKVLLQKVAYVGVNFLSGHGLSSFEIE